MSVDEPPSIGSLGAATQQFKQWGQGVPDDVLQLDRVALSRWFADTGKLVDAVTAQALAASGLRIDEGVVGNFQSAKATAENLNDTGDAIRQRLSEYAQFATALRDFSSTAFNALLNADEH
ncbi:hypothetical protein [Mycobacterium asiaticum]|nr:hypothetical protein [Mycobacterium asiaticum]